jgi:hypothetical protein
MAVAEIDGDGVFDSVADVVDAIEGFVVHATASGAGEQRDSP